MQKLVINNYEVRPFAEFLYELNLKGKDSRMRSRFFSLLEEQVKLISKEREILMSDFAKKDEEGNPITNTDEQGNEFVILEDTVMFNLEISKLMKEQFIISVEGKEEMIKTVQDVVLDIDKEFSGVEAEKYNRYCEILESVVFE